MIRSVAERFLRTNLIKETRRQFRVVSSCNFPRRIPINRRPETEFDNYALSDKYKIFEDSTSPIIKHTDEELREPPEDNDLDYGEFEGLSFKRGVTGVFDIEDLVAVLKRENAKNIFVCAVPQDIVFVNYICIITGRSSRHMLAIAEFIRKLYKKKRYETDPIPNIEGIESKDWIAIDLGNIALHIFSNASRSLYDIEQLWAVGSEFDSNCQKPDDELNVLIEKHSIHLKDLEPAESRKTSLKRTFELKIDK